MKEISITEFLTKRFPTEGSATAFFAEKRWDGKVTCPYCGSEKIYQGKGKQPYKCSECNNKFTVKTGTIMEGSHVDVRIWLFAMYIMGTSRKGISSIQFAKLLGVTQKTAWYMAHRIREACNEYEKLKGIVEADETYAGGKEKNKHANHKLGGRGTANKTPILGLKQCGGSFRGKVSDNTDIETMNKYIKANVETESTIYTDEFSGYQELKNKGYNHTTVNHNKGNYVNGDVHTNSIESFWALLKRGIYGTYHHVSKKHLQRYVNEFAFKASNGNFAFPFINAVCLQANGNVLHYNQLIG